MAYQHWSSEQIFNLIEAYRSHECLWRTTSVDYSCRDKKDEAWREIAKCVGADVRCVERKIKTLKTQFANYHKMALKKATERKEDFEKPKWFAYSALEFLLEGRSTAVNGSLMDNSFQIRLSRDDGTCASGSGSASQSAMWECHNPTIDMECSNNGDMETENMDTGYYLPAEAILKEPKVETNCQYGSVLQDVLSFVKSLQHSNDVRDEFSIFGEHIAARLRKIRDSRIRLLAQHRIHCALFDVEIDELNNYNLSNKQLNSQNACNTQVEHSEPIAGENFATSQKEEVLAMTDSSLSATPSQPPNREPELEVEKEASSISPENTSNEDHVTNESSDEK
ncbi:uncharacterized protein LOC108667549 isoform X2 [Hyalella azteca]|uniref:Uncharacterized protein LOC108667549 isoform X2 n=1 Tax=Hyalella azteca TaxID=294128 RepID=A0A8B7N8W3_HYAAZ|nr:uncharacterized protein LOC108667549 isoform X2 [Hyalella azteca]